jgi:TRAP-type mannitol/chloroaromatic compound transport system permease small subunit
MNYVRVLIALAILDFMLLSVWVGTSAAENCEHGGLACNELIGDVVPFAFAAGLVAFVCVALAGVAKLVRRMGSRGLLDAHYYQCRKCDWRSETEDAAIGHAEHAHGAMSYLDMRDTWTRH